MIEPRIQNVPLSATTAGDDAIDLARAAGIDLDDWQQHLLRLTLGERPDGKWTAGEVGILVARQNGKSEFLVARALAGLYLFGERTIMFSAHQFKTTREIFLRIRNIIEASPSLKKQLKDRGVRTGSGSESIELKNGNRLLFVARSKSSGRGFSPDVLLFDEAQELSQEEVDAMLPSLSARPNPQIVYSGTVPGPLMNSAIWTRVRDRGRKGDDARLAWIEWSSGEDFHDLDDRAGWVRANPAHGVRIHNEFIELERAALGDDAFGRERLSIWPSGINAGAFGSAWPDSIDPASTIESHLTFALAIPRDRSSATIGVSGRNAQGRTHLEVIDTKRGTSWVVDRLVHLAGTTHEVVIDGKGPAGSLIPALEDAGVRVLVASTGDVCDACAGLYDGVQESRVVHLSDPDLDTAVAGAKRREVGDRWAWGRRTSVLDIAPLEAVTLAAWAVSLADDRPALDSLYF